MKLEYYSDKKMHSRISRSLSHDTLLSRIRRAGKASTRLFSFERLNCKDTRLNRQWTRTDCIKVIVILTGEKFVATGTLFFGDFTWDLYKIVEE